MANGNNEKKIPRGRVYQHFITLPEGKRKQLLRKHFTPEAIEDIGKRCYTDALMGLANQPKEKALAFLNDPKKAGGPIKKLLSLAEEVCRGFMRGAYNHLSPNASDAEKLLTLIKGNTLGDRVKNLWQDGVSQEAKTLYLEKGLAEINTEVNVPYRLENPENYKPGSNLDSFLSDIQATMDLSKEKSAMGHLRGAVLQNDSRKEEKLRRALQQYTFQPESKVNPAELAQKLRSQDWEKSLDPKAPLNKPNGYTLQKVVVNTKAALESIPETDADKELLREAALQTCQEVNRQLKPDQKFSERKDFEALARELQDQVVQQKLKAGIGSELRTELAGAYAALTKVKKGFMLSSTNTKEHNDMTRALRLFQAKLLFLEGKPLPGDMDPEEAKTVRESDVGALFDSARHTCYNYGCLKTKYGKNGFVHRAGEDRFDASLKALTQLHKLGNALLLGQPAALLSEEVQQQLLKNRRNEGWLQENAENLAARTLYAQELLADGKSWDEQSRLLTEEKLQAKVEKIKELAGFKQLVNSLGPKGLADAAIQGVTQLGDLYRSAVEKVQQKPEDVPEALKAQKGGAGITVNK